MKERKFKIMLDAGHHGSHYNQSTVIPEYYESNFTWDFHLMLKEELEKYGFVVGTTRKSKEKDLEVTRRGRRGKGYDLFISIHSNASGNPNKDRVAIYHQVQTGDEHEMTSLAFAKHMAPIVNHAMECTGSPCVGCRPGDTDLDRDGMPDDYYGVLRGASLVGCPAVIIEHSYHTNERATRWLMDKDNLEALANIEAEAIAEFFGVKEQFKIGDVNGDGKVDTKDYVIAKRIFLGTYNPTPEELARCDINGDGKFTATDYVMLKRMVLGTYKK